MTVIRDNSMNLSSPQRGFTLIELMIVVAIIGVIAAIAYPNYQQYVIKSKRTDMMSEMHNIASEIQSRKLAQGSYTNSLKAGLEGNYPKHNALYTVAINPVPLTPPLNTLTSKWIITATPVAGTQMANDGTMSLNHQGVKCRATICSTGNDWN